MKRGAFALILALFLVVLLGSLVSGLAATVSTEAAVAGWSGDTLDHRLALDSFLALYPTLQAKASASHGDKDDERGRAWMELSFARCFIRCKVMEESRKVSCGAGGESVLDQLREAGRENGLRIDGLQPLPIMEGDEFDIAQRFVWFDQLVALQEFGEVFAWPLQAGDRNVRNVLSWSDLITFWVGVRGAVGMQINTAIGTDVRRWYVVAVEDGERLLVLYRSPIWF